MNLDLSIGVLIAAALLLANLPFLNERWLACGPRARAGAKNLFQRLLELVLCYVLTGALGLALEQSAGQIAPQGWEFYAITASLFLTLAFPGFVYRYLSSHRR
ncbi:DUF2818 family protein [Macromonas bipunctata]|uniref:DUF2818 family protein n=1 Tax=Macromonas bipunctata TaxID=183670 RepID=UPI000C348237|nr:DUF2818 family protein [Macromonas bipunctata]